MTSVFLSYDRDDVGKARAIALALEKAGHSVWWDRHIKSGAQYSKEIESALKAANAVVVLWSERSIESAWVRDEAAAGRDTGRLVPVTIGNAEPPLGFRQYQTTDLAKWKGRTSAPQFQELLAAVENLGGVSPIDAPASPTKRALRRPNSAILIGVIVAIGLMVGVLVWRPWSRGSSTPVVAVAAASPSAESKTLAREMLAKLGSLHSAHSDGLKLVQGGEDPGKADFIFEVDGATAGQAATANLVLLHGKDRSILWSSNFKPPSGNPADLKQQLAYAAARVLDCALEAVTAPIRLDNEPLKSFLGGCAEYAELSGTSVREVRRLIPIFERVTKESPAFPGGWARLVSAEAEVMASSMASDRSSIEPSLRRHVALARQLNADMPELLEAEILLLPLVAVGKRLELVDRALMRHPDHPRLLGLRARLLMAVGRLRAAVQDAKRAADIDSLSPAMRGAYIFALAHSGQLDVALYDLAEALSTWPGAKSINEMRFTINLRYGAPEEALRQLKAGSFRSDIPASQESLLQARLDRVPKKIDRAIAEALASRSIRQLVQVLAEFGHNEQAIGALLKHDANDPEQFTDVLFRPHTRELRKDRRFILVAKRFGLVDYWMKSSNWSDFCFDPDLPYDCKVEAAKLAS